MSKRYKMVALYVFYFLVVLSIIPISCLVFSTEIYLVRPHTEEIKSPTKAHMIDGSVVVFKSGFKKEHDRLTGPGIHYNLTRNDKNQIQSVAVDSVAFLEYYEMSSGTSTLGAVLAPAVVIGGLTNEDIKKSIFGSCPTVYTFNGKDYNLQAECFSYSVHPGAEDNDLDLLEGGIEQDNYYWLKLTNEALETHYINQMNLIIVDHSSEFKAFPNENQKITIVSQNWIPFTAKDRAGRDVSALISSRDDKYYRTDSIFVHQLTQNINHDWIELEFKTPPEASHVNMVFRLRNTLFNTVFFYDSMLKSAGLHSLDLMAGEGINLMFALKFRNWYRKHFDLKVQVWDGKDFNTETQIGDSGPIAWHHVAVKIPLNNTDSNRVRITSLPDNWMIDWLGISHTISEDYRISESKCADIDGIRKINPTLLHSDDQLYMLTFPGDEYHLKFKVPQHLPGMSRTYFLKSCGYYIEWLRQDWISGSDTENEKIVFALTDRTIMETAGVWVSKKDQFEKEFFSSKISVLAK